MPAFRSNNPSDDATGPMGSFRVALTRLLREHGLTLRRLDLGFSQERNDNFPYSAIWYNVPTDPRRVSIELTCDVVDEAAMHRPAPASPNLLTVLQQRRRLTL